MKFRYRLYVESTVIGDQLQLTQFSFEIQCYRVVTGQEIAREKNVILQGQGKVREFYFESGKNDILKKSQGKLN